MKTYRVYFNRKREAPQVWSVDEGTQASEINVCKVVLHGVRVESVYIGAVSDSDTHPSAYMSIEAEVLTIADGTAYLFGLNSKEFKSAG